MTSRTPHRPNRNSPRRTPSDNHNPPGIGSMLLGSGALTPGGASQLSTPCAATPGFASPGFSSLTPSNSTEIACAPPSDLAVKMSEELWADVRRHLSHILRQEASQQVSEMKGALQDVQEAKQRPVTPAIEELVAMQRKLLTEWPALFEEHLERANSELRKFIDERLSAICVSEPLEDAADGLAEVAGGANDPIPECTAPSHPKSQSCLESSEQSQVTFASERRPRLSQKSTPDESTFKHHGHMATFIGTTDDAEKLGFSPAEVRRQQRAIKRAKSAAPMGLCGRLCYGDEMGPVLPSGLLVNFVNSPTFGAACAMLIVTNTIFIGVETDYAMKVALAGEEMPPIFKLVNRVFAGAFSLELVAKILAYRSWWILGPEFKWNLFDAFLVLSSLLQEVFAGVNVSFMRIFRVFRIVRVARIIRVVRAFRELRRMVCAIGSCLASLSWALLLLLLIMYVFSVFFVQGATGAVLQEHTRSQRARLTEWYPSILGTMFSLLLCISGGSDWWPVLEPLAEVSAMYAVGFTFYIVFVTFGVLNVLTGVFLENATEFTDKDLVIQAQMMRNDAFIEEMSVFFNEFDHEHIGQINYERFQEFVSLEEVYAYLASHQMESQDADSLFKLLDRDEEGTIDIGEFINGCLKLKGEARCMDIAVMLRQQECQEKALRALQADVADILDSVKSLAWTISDASKKPSPRGVQPSILRKRSD